MKNCLITGGTSGLGIELAKVFLLNNYFVHIIGRNKKKFEIFIKNIDVELKKKVFFYEIDLSEIKNIKNSFDKIKKLNINVLINNAGVINLNRRLNSTNLEQAFVVNYLSHYYLTNKLIENSSIVRKGVIVNISSFTHIFSNINFTNIDLKKRGCKGLSKYLRSELVIGVDGYHREIEILINIERKKLNVWKKIKVIEGIFKMNREYNPREVCRTMYIHYNSYINIDDLYITGYMIDKNNIIYGP